MQYGLRRIEDTATGTLTSEHGDLLTGIAAGRHAVEVEDFDYSYGLYTGGVRVARFAEGRIGYREWARRTGRLHDVHSLYDRDVDELMSR